MAVHQFCQALTDGQTQPWAAEIARGRTICLNKGLEQAIKRFWRNADAGVFDLKTDEDLRFCFLLNPHTCYDLARRREFDGIADQTR
jgi:hypothetical protein